MALLEADRAYLPSHFERWVSFRGYLSAMSLAVSVPRGAIAMLEDILTTIVFASSTSTSQQSTSKNSQW